MIQPIVTNAAVENPNSSAPKMPPITTSRPVLSCPSTCTRMRPLRSLSTRTCWVSESPNSHGSPACLMDVCGEAPVPPSCPEMSTPSARALETPAAIVPTPASATSLTLTSASGFALWRSKINCCRSSIE